MLLFISSDGNVVDRYYRTGTSPFFFNVNYPFCTFAEGVSIHSFLIQVLTLMAGVYWIYVLASNRTDFSEPKSECIYFRASVHCG